MTIMTILVSETNITIMTILAIKTNIALAEIESGIEYKEIAAR